MNNLNKFVSNIYILLDKNPDFNILEVAVLHNNHLCVTFIKNNCETAVFLPYSFWQEASFMSIITNLTNEMNFAQTFQNPKGTH